MQSKVRLVSITQPEIKVEDQTLTPEGLIAYCARVSSPNQENLEYSGLVKYCIDHKHWSIFEMVDMTVEITTSRAISPQILRHRSFCFQEFSQRYAKVKNDDFETYSARRQDVKNRQNSIEDLDYDTEYWFYKAQESIQQKAMTLYEEALDRNIAKECARVLLPLGTRTKLYMKGSLRSWIHYLQVRTDPGTQKEHRDIAEEVLKIFKIHFPITSKSLGW